MSSIPDLLVLRSMGGVRGAVAYLPVGIVGALAAALAGGVDVRDAVVAGLLCGLIGAVTIALVTPHDWWARLSLRPRALFVMPWVAAYAVLVTRRDGELTTGWASFVGFLVNGGLLLWFLDARQADEADQ
ncbi:MAG: hypothetical protein ABIM89_02805 [Mycobacteriales bacterium]